ncbi:uncharacterized protein [Nicotiana tomentosiformis]|uniref:uncharacterized protein n=1 Tax=Nicotiana tomentosiformis TaxID=4098 RepID=UPI00388C8CE9
MVANSLSRKVENMGSLAYSPVGERPLALDVQDLANQPMRLDVLECNRVLTCMVPRSSLYERIRKHQYDNPNLFVLKDTMQHGDARRFLFEMMGVVDVGTDLCAQCGWAS